MQPFRPPPLILPLLLLLGGIACGPSRSTPSTQSITMKTPAPDAILPSVALMARNEQFEPNGIPDGNADRPIAFATVVLQLSNPSDRPIQIRLQSIEIRDSQTEQLQMALQQFPQIVLQPLEHRSLDLQLSRPEDYGDTQSVKARVTYQWAWDNASTTADNPSPSHTFESEAIAIQQW